MKHFMQWFNSTIIMQVTNKVFIVFSPKISLDTNTCSFFKIGLLWQ